MLERLDDIFEFLLPGGRPLGLDAPDTYDDTDGTVVTDPIVDAVVFSVDVVLEVANIVVATDMAELLAAVVVTVGCAEIETVGTLAEVLNDATVCVGILCGNTMSIAVVATVLFVIDIVNGPGTNAPPFFS